MAMDELIERIGNAVVSPYPVASLEAVQAAEANLGFELPELLRSLYLRVGNGGYGPPGAALIGLTGGELFLDEFTLDSLYASHRQESRAGTFPLVLSYKGSIMRNWPDRLVQFVEWPEAIFSCVDCSEQEAPVYIFDGNFVDGHNTGRPIPIFQHMVSLAEWLDAWINRVDLFEQMYLLTVAEIEKMTR